MLNELLIILNDSVLGVWVVVDARAVHKMAEVLVLDVRANLHGLFIILH